MRNYTSLPEGYREHLAIDLQKNKKLALFVNGLALLIAVAMVVPACFLVPISSLFQVENGMTAYWIRCGSLLVLLVAYMVLHELIHGIAMKLCGTKKVRYGYKGLYAFAGSEDYYPKGSYIFIALAPVVLWGAVIAVVNCFVPVTWFWVVYILQVVNISGAAGDFYVSVKFARLPKNVLIRDYGVGMIVYTL